MRTRRALVAVAAAVLAAVGIAAVPAHADDSPWLSCVGHRPVRGHLRVGAIRFETTFLKVDGTIRPCVKPSTDNEFAIVLFFGPPSRRGVYYSSWYTDNTRSGYFRDALALVDEVDLRAVCLSSREGGTAGSSHRVDCVAVTWTARDHDRDRLPRIGRHLATTDPLVRRGADKGRGYRPGCPHCWD